MRDFISRQRKQTRFKWCQCDVAMTTGDCSSFCFRWRRLLWQRATHERHVEGVPLWPWPSLLQRPADLLHRPGCPDETEPASCTGFPVCRSRLSGEPLEDPMRLELRRLPEHLDGSGAQHYLRSTCLPRGPEPGLQVGLPASMSAEFGEATEVDEGHDDEFKSIESPSQVERIQLQPGQWTVSVHAYRLVVKAMNHINSRL